MHTMLPLAICNGWRLRHIDVNNAFLKGELKEEVFMLQPLGFKVMDETSAPLVCQLDKALYGLHQSPRKL